MTKATLTSKGQLTIPKEVRERLGLRTGDRVVFELEEDSARLKVERRRTLDELKGSLPAKRPYPGKEAEREAAREMAVRIEKILCAVLHEAHRRQQVEETMEILAEGPEGFYKSHLD